MSSPPEKTMSILELARRAYARLKAQSNGHCGGYDINDRNDKSPPNEQAAPICHCAGNDKSPPYMLVATGADLSLLIAALEETTLVGLDVETTGLDPRRDRVRLLSVCCDTNDGGRFSYLVDCFAVDPAPLWKALSGKALVLHNAAFDLAFLARMGFAPEGAAHCTLSLSRVLYAGLLEKHGLEDCVRRELGRDMDKVMQRSDWSGALTPDQLVYAARDVDVLAPLHRALATKLAEADLGAVAEMESRCVPALAWLARSGVAVDREAWLALVRGNRERAADLRGRMQALAPVRPGEMYAMWNWDSPQDMAALFQALGFQVQGTADGVLAGIDHPLAGLLREYREATKLLSSFGEGWLKHVEEDGRVYAAWKQTGSDAGRMSCENPNLQQIPRNRAYRRCFAAPVGRVLVKADYSQLELRIAAKVSGDEALLAAYQRGEDVHTQTARLVLGKEDVSKEDRQLAKALNFGLLYGMSARGFQANARAEYGLDLTEAQAQEYRAAFFRAYPGLARWHDRVKRRHAPETRTLAGRRRLIPDPPRDTDPEKRRRWLSACDRQRINTPVQGTGGDGIKLALALLWDRRGQAPGAFPVLAVHDEIVVECDEGQGVAVAAWLKQAMLDAMLPLIEPVPVEVDVTVARTWGGG
jgi:DNA polymerase-1